MEVLAFMFSEYDNPSPRSMFRGRFPDEEVALETLRGSRYTYKYLQLLTPETLQFKTYVWLPSYDVDYGHFNGNQAEQKVTLTKRYTKQGEEEVIETTYFELNSHNGKFYDHYKAGRWSSHIND